MEKATLFVELGLCCGAGGGRARGIATAFAIPLYLLVGLALGEGGLYPLVTPDSFVHAGAEIGIVLGGVTYVLLLAIAAPVPARMLR